MAILRTVAEKVEPRHTALLIVDVQRDFCAPDGAFAQLGRDLKRIDSMLPHLQRLVASARQAGVMLVFLRYTQTPLTESEVLLEQRSRGRADIPYCREGSPGAEFYAVLPEQGDAVVTKHRYSGFINTDLDVILRSRGIRTLVMTGVATNGCVEATARDGFMHDYYVVLVDDCAATYVEELHQATLTNIGDASGVVVKGEELSVIWDGTSAGQASFPSSRSVADDTR
ncbi:MAG: isochorismatase family cysteine hydrolase [Candidatus Dormiibacterota bacterium]